MGHLAGLKTSLCHCIPIHTALCSEDTKTRGPTYPQLLEEKQNNANISLNSSESDHNGPSLENPSPLPSELLPFFKELKGHLFLPLALKGSSQTWV